ncbi:MAG: hypothetical protein MJZ66_07695 [Bacteroidales bacterium]|nr:hypothetical protein [Bacteroidales bacterium]
MNPFSTELLNKITSILVKRFISAGSLTPDDYDDMVQTLRTRYLAKKSHIESLYKGDAQPQTYMTSVLRMMLLEELRNMQKTKIATEDIDSEGYHLEKPDRSLSPEQQAIIDNEKQHLQRVMMTLGKDRAKILMCLKMQYRIPVSQLEWLDYLNGRQANGAEEYLKFGEQELNKDIFARLCNITNLVEGAQNKPDAIRIWLSTKIDQITKRMNATGKSKYDSETLGILMECMYVYR